MVRLSDAMRQLRPVVETGYENVLLARLCIEQVGGRPASTTTNTDQTGRQAGRADGGGVCGVVSTCRAPSRRRLSPSRTP